MELDELEKFPTVADKLRAAIRLHRAAVPPPKQRRDMAKSRALWTQAMDLIHAAQEQDPGRADEAWDLQPSPFELLAFYESKGL